jgi:hypothetical protein
LFFRSWYFFVKLRISYQFNFIPLRFSTNHWAKKTIGKYATTKSNTLNQIGAGKTDTMYAPPKKNKAAAKKL